MMGLRGAPGGVAPSLVSCRFGRSNQPIDRIRSLMRTVSTFLACSGYAIDQVRGGAERFVDSEAFAVSAMIIWLAPRPTRALEPGVAH